MIIERRTAIAKGTTKVVEKVILLFSISPFPSCKGDESLCARSKGAIEEGKHSHHSCNNVVDTIVYNTQVLENNTRSKDSYPHSNNHTDV